MPWTVILLLAIICGKSAMVLASRTGSALLRSTSAGLGAGITNCGVVVDIYELFGSEGCSQASALISKLGL